VCQLSRGKLLVDHVTGEGSLFDVPPAAIGRYRVQHPLGAGTCGPVFRADAPTGESVAIKLLTIPIRPERVDAVLDTLHRVVADGLAVDGTVTPVEAGLHDGTTPFLVTALASGDSLDVALRRFGPALLVDVLPRLAVLADALDLLVSRDLHHGALHPRDIVVDEASTLMTGVGVWQALAAGGVRLPRRSPYRAPELADLALSGAGDQFSLAAVAYEWMTGRRSPAAFVAGDMAASVGTRRESLGAVFARAMHLDPAHRFPTCRAFVDELMHVDSGRTDGPESSRVAEERPRRRPRPAAEPLPLLALDLDAPAASEMPLQSADIDAVMAVSAALPDLPLQSTGRDDTRTLSEVPMADAASEFSDAWPVARLVTSAPTHPSADIREELEDARLSGDHTMASESGTGMTDHDEEAHLTPAAFSGVPALPVRGTGTAGMRPPQESPSETPTADAWMARLLLVAFGVALGVSIGYATWGWSDAEPGGGQSAAMLPVSTDATPAMPVAEPVGRPTSVAAEAGTESARTIEPVAGPPISVPAASERSASVAGSSGASDLRSVSASSAAPAAAPKNQTRRQVPAAGPRVTSASRGAVRALSTPPGAMVMLDGKLVGKAPMTVRNVTPGSHSIEFRRQGHRPVTRPVQVKAGATASVSATLPRAQEPQ